MFTQLLHPSKQWVEVHLQSSDKESTQKQSLHTAITKRKCHLHLQILYKFQRAQQWSLMSCQLWNQYKYLLAPHSCRTQDLPLSSPEISRVWKELEGKAEVVLLGLPGLPILFQPGFGQAEVLCENWIASVFTKAYCDTRQISAVLLCPLLCTQEKEKELEVITPDDWPWSQAGIWKPR